MSFRQYQPKDVFDYIVRYKLATDGNSPSLRQIQDEFGMKSVSTADWTIKCLQRDGKVYKKDGRICISGGVWSYEKKS